jgi:nitrilase
VFASVGNARFLDAQGLDLTVVDANTSTAEQPLVYQSFNTTGLAATVPYTTNGEQSWGILQQIAASFPSYIPKVTGDFVTRQINPIANLLASAGSQ